MFVNSLSPRLLVGCNLIKRSNSLLLSGSRNTTTFPSDPNFLENVTAAKTSCNPVDHTKNHIGMWYTVAPDTAHQLYYHFGLNIPYKELCQIIGETSFVIRKPAITIIDIIKRSNLEQIPNKLMLYGKKGCGKSLTLSHVMHYLYEDDWIIAHVHSPSTLCCKFKEIIPSLSRADHYDHTTDAAKYLQHFLSLNLKKIEKQKLTTSKSYEWSKREVTAEGSSLINMAEFGIQRPKFASEVVYSLNWELKNYANQNRCKVAVIFDGLNTMFHPITHFLREDRSVVPVKLFTFFQAFRQFLQPDWKNGCIVSSLNLEMSTKDRRKSFLPRYLLRTEGWELLDPFLPIHVEGYNEHELNNVINYYVEKNWLCHDESTSPDCRIEFKYISGGNGLELLNMINAH